MSCPECGARARPTSAFCTACGADLVDVRGAATTGPTPVRGMVGTERAAWIDSVWGVVGTTNR